MTSFVYKWTDILHNKFYIGVHKVGTREPYICGSKYVREQIKVRPNDFKRDILAEFENYEDAYTFETKILQEVDAAKNPQYYNGHNNIRGKFYCKGHTVDSRTKISNSLKNIPKSEEHRHRIRLSQVGKFVSEEIRHKMSLARKGKKLVQGHYV